MSSGVWRFLALAGALIALGFVVADTVDVRGYTDDHMTIQSADGRSYAHLRIDGVSGSTAENGGLRAGDIITPLDPMTSRMYGFGSEPAGTVHRWSVQRGTERFTASTVVSPVTADDLMLYQIFNVVRLAMILIAMVVAARRPDVPAARTLVTFLVTLALTLTGGGAWLPDPAFAAWRLLRGPIQIFSLSQGLQYACIFPFASERGLRAWLRRINPWYALVTACAVFAFSVWIRSPKGMPDLGGLVTIVDWSPIIFIPAMAVAFGIAAAAASGRDRQRLYWAAGSICLGFSGPVVVTVLVIGLARTDEWIEFLALTLIAMPAGLAYTILRHRTVDIGFVISRALVLTVLSALVILAFGLLERALGKLFIDASHIASRSFEIALALGLGFSLRGLHARIERVIDRIFFSRRQRALAALKTFGNDVYFITDPDVALERTVEVVGRSAEAGNVALYLIADGVFGLAAGVEADGLPAELSENEPLFVRMRASRHAELARDAGSDLDAEIGFPMFVRATLVGALVLGAKRSGEAYDPEEVALLAELAQRVGIALDALQTVVMRRELEALMTRTDVTVAPG
jgi:hypothetical protein